MQSGSFISSDVQALVSRVLVNGVQRPHASWSVDRELSGDLPAQVVATSGVTQATGTVVWAEAADVSDVPTNPWNRSNGWIPGKGDRVEIYAGDSTTEWKQFTGVIDKTSGTIGADLQSTLIDDYDRLSNPVTHEPLLNKMPPVTPGGDFLGTGLVHTFYVDLAMRAGRFFTTPSREPNAVVHVPCQGGMWPHLGKVTAASAPSGASYPSNNFSPWGFSVGDFRATYEPTSPQSMSAPMQMTAIVAPGHNGFFTLHAYYGSSYVRLSVNASWVVNANIDGNLVAAFTLAGKGAGENRIVQLLVKGGEVTIKSSGGQVASGSYAFSGPTLLSSVQAYGDLNSRLSGLQVSHPPAAYEFRDLNFTPSARINVANSTFMGVPHVIPAIESVPGSDLLNEISEASLSAVWIDELGVLQWWPALSLRGRTPNSTLTTLDDIFDLAWEDSLLGSRSSVTVKYQEPALKVSKWQNVELAVGSGETLGSGDVSEQFYAPTADEVWIKPDYIQNNIGPGSWNLYNAKRGTLAGSYFTLDGDETASAYTVSVSNEKLGITGAMKMTHTAGTFPAGVEANLSTSPTDPVLKIQNRDKPLPRIAGHARAEYIEREYTSTVPGGVGPALVHETGKWIPADIVSNIADFLASETATPKPVITGLEVAYDPRRQLGDTVTIESTRFMGVTMTALVVGVSNSADSGGYTQSLSVRIVDVKRTNQTYAEYNDSLSATNLTYAQWQALGPLPQTYAQFNES